MSKSITFVRSLCGLKNREEGATMVEYGLMVALISVVCVVAVALLGTNIKAMFTSVAGSI